MKITVKDTVILNEDVIETELDDEIVMLSVTSGRYYTLNKTGSYILNKIKTPNSVEKLIQEIQQEFSIPIELATNDVLLFLNSATKERLVHKSST